MIQRSQRLDICILVLSTPWPRNVYVLFSSASNFLCPTSSNVLSYSVHCFYHYPCRLQCSIDCGKTNKASKCCITEYTSQIFFKFVFSQLNLTVSVSFNIDSLICMQILGFNLAVGIDGCLGRSMIREGHGLLVCVRRSLKDVFRKVPTLSIEVRVILVISQYLHIQFFS